MLDGLLVVVVHAKGGVAAANFLAVAHREPSLGNTWGDMLAKATDGRRKGNRRENNSWPAAKAHCCQHCNRCWSQRAVADQPAHGTRWQNSCRARCGLCQEEVLARRPLQPCRSVGELQEGSPQLLLQLPLPLFACTFRQRHRIKHQSRYVGRGLRGKGGGLTLGFPSLQLALLLPLAGPAQRCGRPAPVAADRLGRPAALAADNTQVDVACVKHIVYALLVLTPARHGKILAGAQVQIFLAYHPVSVRNRSREHHDKAFSVLQPRGNACLPDLRFSPQALQLRTVQLHCHLHDESRFCLAERDAFLRYLFPAACFIVRSTCGVFLAGRLSPLQQCAREDERNTVVERDLVDQMLLVVKLNGSAATDEGEAVRGDSESVPATRIVGKRIRAFAKLAPLDLQDFLHV